MTVFSIKDRPKTIENLKSEVYDLVIIGGGITGGGLALQAAASGLKTALIDMQDFSAGTSSRSTKLVHGGIRYLKQFDVEVVSDTVSERAVVQHIAPHVPKAETMLMPIYDEPETTFTHFRLEIAMALYDYLAGIDKTSPQANRILNRDEVLQIQPNLQRENLVGGGLYLDYSSEDTRLVIENIKQAVADGADAVSRLKAVDFEYNEDNKITALKVEDQIHNEAFRIKSREFINTTGHWSDTIRSLDKYDTKGAQMRPTKGIHLVVDYTRLPLSQPTYFDSGEEDGRMIFAIPYETKIYFGTTDTDYDGDYTDPDITQEDVDYLLSIINRRFPDAQIEESDIESSWAGLRPLIDPSASQNGEADAISGASSDSLSEDDLDPSEVSRGSDLSLSDSGLMTLAGGKITDYRKMALGAMEMILERLAEKGRHFELIDSKTYPVSGGWFSPYDIENQLNRFAELARAKGFSDAESHDLANLYGSNTPEVLTYLDQAKEISKKYNYPIFIAISLLYSLDYEATYTLNDYFTRRTMISLFRSEQVEDLINPVASTIQEILDLSDEVIKEQKEEYAKERKQMTLAHLN